MDMARTGEAGRAERAAKNVAIIRASGAPAGPKLKATLMVATQAERTATSASSLLVGFHSAEAGKRRNLEAWGALFCKPTAPPCLFRRFAIAYIARRRLGGACGASSPLLGHDGIGRSHDGLGRSERGEQQLSAPVAGEGSAGIASVGEQPDR